MVLDVNGLMNPIYFNPNLVIADWRGSHGLKLKVQVCSVHCCQNYILRLLKSLLVGKIVWQFTIIKSEEKNLILKHGFYFCKILFLVS